jgi:MFS family permease
MILMETNPEDRKIEFGQGTLDDFNVMRRWALFIAIVGFIVLGLVILIGIITGVFLSFFNAREADQGIPAYAMVLIFIVLGVIYFLPALFLYKFSKHTNRAIHSPDKQEINRGIKYLKYYFVIIGLLIILGIVLYLVTFIITGASVSFLKGMG